MLSEFKFFRHAVVLLLTTVVGVVLFYPSIEGKTAAPEIDELNKQMERLKQEMEKPGSSPALADAYTTLANKIGECNPLNEVFRENGLGDALAPTASLCINGSIAGTDPSWQRPATQSTGSGIQAGCPLTAGVNKEYDVYSFNLTGCTVFPTEVTITDCGPAGCQHLGNLDTTLYVYRSVAAGDPLTANGGLPGAFNPASPCTNVRAAQDDLGTTVGTTNNPGGSTCNQVVGANCVGPCTSPTGAGALSGLRRQFGSGRFTVVVSGFGDTTAGPYNLYVNAPAAGCQISLAPSAARGSITGRVLTARGSGVSMALVTISGGNLPTPVVVRTNNFGYYNLRDLEPGAYVVTVQSKKHVFAEPTQIVNLQDDIAEANFISEE